MVNPPGGVADQKVAEIRAFPILSHSCLIRLSGILSTSRIGWLSVLKGPEICHFLILRLSQA